VTICQTCNQRVPDVARRAWTATIPMKVTTSNGYVVNHGASRWKYKQARNDWEAWFAAKFREARGAETFRRVTFVRLYSGREREFDYANLVGGMKPVVDAMKNVGLIVDDSTRWIEDHYRQERAEESGLRVTIEEF
jgi:hypothetical protein